MEIIKQYKGLPRQVYYLLIVRIIIAMGGFVYPFLTMFLSSRMGMDEVRIGRFLLLVAVANLPASLLGGKLADKFPRKYVYVLAMLTGDLFFVSCGFLISRKFVIWLILCGYFCLNLAQPSTSAMMMDLTTPENRQESFSLIYLGLNLGVAVGPLVAGFLFEHFMSWIFWGQASLNLLAMMIVLIFIRETKPDEETMEEVSHEEDREDEAFSTQSLVGALLSHPIVLVFALFSISYPYGYSQLSYLLPLHLEATYPMELASKYVGFIWSLNGICVFLSTPLFVWLLKKRSPLGNLCLSGLLYTVGFGLYYYCSSLAMMYLLVLVWTAGEVVAATNSGVFIANHAPISHRARFQSIYDIIQGIGRAIGPLSMGLFLQFHTMPEGWRMVSRFCLISAAGFFILRCVEKKKKEKIHNN